MQSWGTHTYEDIRPTHGHPTRSALIGLLGACLGIDRRDLRRKKALNDTVDLAVLVEEPKSKAERVTRLVDFHTVMDSRKVDGTVNKHPIVTSREYLCDAKFTVAVGIKLSGEFSLSDLVAAVKKPYYTPVLGRKCCPLSEPLFLGLHSSTDIVSALQESTDVSGVIYSEQPSSEDTSSIVIRDVPLYRANVPEFDTRTVYSRTFSKEKSDVPK